MTDVIVVLLFAGQVMSCPLQRAKASKFSSIVAAMIPASESEQFFHTFIFGNAFVFFVLRARNNLLSLPYCLRE